jgi:hypothetical protein
MRQQVTVLTPLAPLHHPVSEAQALAIILASDTRALVQTLVLIRVRFRL